MLKITILAGVIAVALATALSLHVKHERAATAYPGPRWTEVNYDIERVAIEGGWLYRSKGKLVFVPGAKV